MGLRYKQTTKHKQKRKQLTAPVVQQRIDTTVKLTYSLFVREDETGNNLGLDFFSQQRCI